ncbi:hypothetical protein FEK33_29185 [Nocardia asteroides NBRC 15531]|uniref:GH18 domain-containing protein n=1 Tax=Nocardia asteroides NBRC 15531 TaxID=1110697 RepID=U5E7L3_NOCAS|nr:hypothetical protein [Nocardia asteroides]TLF62528.1 hypothetical protein FEK33_29185 [Nocardia asteroides NBRC 15531]UGT46741.1 hypothetical protein LT345_19600 [Nocardia asteroides]SFN63602.1 hypothetical protein SAMN05444423_11199 [Nocardia asteroides]VEG34409.1 Predicted glycosyl hydrolase [Nocardia asteroides]GAD83285.1 hypothetical protein NCAST_18_01380 [Nocardia asteroides NBRC 15531]
MRGKWHGWSWWTRGAVIALMLLVVLATPVVVAVAYLLGKNVGEQSEQARSRGMDAFWLGHAWVDGRKTDADVDQLAILLAGTGIRDLYVHTGPLEHDGSLRDELAPRAAWFVGAVHAKLPGIRVQSWLGDVVQPEFDGLDVESVASRERVVASARRVLAYGFDGVHYDLEPVRSGSPGFLALLDATRTVTAAAGVRLSVSAPVIDPLPGLHSVGLAVADHGKWWSQAYFAEVARRVDQVAVMSYDTAMPTQALYSGYLAQQTELAMEVTPREVDLLMGAPAFWADDPGHHGAAETVAAAVRGIRLGLTATDPTRPTFGIALYVDFAARPQDWTDYRQGWCPPE